MSSHAVDLATAAIHVAKADLALKQWHAREDTAARNYVVAGSDALESIRIAAHLLEEARRQLVGEMHTDEHERVRQVDAMLAERCGQKCLHGEDARHRSSYGPPVYVGCQCAQICCSIAEMTAAAGIAPSTKSATSA